MLLYFNKLTIKMVYTKIIIGDNMKKVIIGILGTSEYMKTNDAFYDVYKYSNNYIKKR